jgi:20S proteasome alpha/beta subunit
MLAHRPPYPSIIINKYKRRPAERDMTVCIGLLCTDGLIIGADTEKSGGLKYFSPKVRRESFAAGEYVLTGTGNVGALGMTADVIKCALRSKQERFKKAVNAEERACIFRDAISGVIRQIHKQHIDTPVYPDQPVYLELILGVHFKDEDEETKLMHCGGDGYVSWIDHHMTAGSGGDIALRFLTILSPGPCPMELMTSVAFFCLAEAKLGAEGASGQSELMKLPAPKVRGWYSDAPIVELAESALRLAVVECRDKSLSKERFDERLKEVFDKILAAKFATDQQIEMEQFTLERIRRLRPPR